MHLAIDDINKLGDVQFEQLVKSLLLSVIGKGVTPFSSGKDGAREATFEGEAEYPSQSQKWNGKWIFQVKYSNVSNGIDKARNQIKYSIDGELSKLESYGYIDSNGCDNYIFITNVPFTGEAEKGLHDYIRKKKESYRIKNFDYWDGEKIISFLNIYPGTRESFFPLKGVSVIYDEELKSLQEIFVEPNQYQQLKKQLFEARFVNIVGQPHVGKTLTAYMLAMELKKSKVLNNIFLIQLIDLLTEIPRIINSAIIFDDLYGDISYHPIGTRTKIISSLNKNNFILITSREDVFKEAISHLPLPQPLHNTQTITQEGSYGNEQLTVILRNHLRYQYSRSSFSTDIIKFVERYKDHIISQLRFPHNIQIFVSSLDNDCFTRERLHEKIQAARKIENVVISWIQNQSEQNKNILLCLAIGRITNVETIGKICSIRWNYSVASIERCIADNTRIIYYDKYVKFRHPSYKTAIINYFSNYKKGAIYDLLFDLFSSDEFSEQKLINRRIISIWLSELDSEKLEVLVFRRNLKAKIMEIVWLNLVSRDLEKGLELFELTQVNKNRYSSRQLDSFVSIKSKMSEGDVIKLILILLRKRTQQNWRLIENLIFLFAFRIRKNAGWILDHLDVVNSSRDLKIKIKILGVIGSKHPESVFSELLSLANSNYLSTRSKVYTALTMLDKSYKGEVRSAFEKLLEEEANEKNKLKLRRLIRSYS